MKESFEIDKLVIAAAIAIFAVIMSANLGNLFYITEENPQIMGYKIEVPEENSGAVAKKGIPDVIDIGAIMQAADALRGEKVFAKCAVCHTIDADGKNKVGPNLWDIVGKATATRQDFAYSGAMQKRGADGGVWGYEDLYRYLYAPARYVEGTKMAFAGVKKDDERADLIAYLRMQSSNPKPLPASKPVAEVAPIEEVGE